MNNVQSNIANLPMLKSDFTYKELKKCCIARGLEFEKAVSYDFPNLSNWLVRHSLSEEDETKVEAFDNWLDDQLTKDGNEYLVHPSLRLSYLGNKNKTEEDEPKKEKVTKVRVKKEKDESGLYKGTKKSYTFELQKRGKTIQDTIIKVTRKFPDAKEKSIKIWFNRSRKDNA